MSCTAEFSIKKSFITSGLDQTVVLVHLNFVQDGPFLLNE